MSEKITLTDFTIRGYDGKGRMTLNDKTLIYSDGTPLRGGDVTRGDVITFDPITNEVLSITHADNYCPWCRVVHEPGKCERLISGGQSD